MSTVRPPNGRRLDLREKETALTPYFSTLALPNAPCFLVLPGGGYGSLVAHEGEGFTYFLNRQGIHAFVLEYRLGTDGYRHPAMLEDASAAMRFLRSNAKFWDMDPHRIGVIGSSAGGHLAATLATQWKHFQDREPAIILRPDLAVLAYPVIAMTGKFAHSGAKENLLGVNASEELANQLSAQTQVSPETPPCFLWHTLEDTVVAVEHSLMFAQSLRAANVPFELHVFEHGHHGLGMRIKDHPWTNALQFWLTKRGWVA